MKKELEDQLHLDYPRLYATKISLDCGDGWFALIDLLSSHLEEYILDLPKDLDNQIHVEQCKEKYGGLRFYLTHETPKMQGAISLAEGLSLRTCEKCGHPGRSRNGGWIKTLCDACHTEE